MSISPANIELSMYTAVSQAQTALGGILQRGLGIQIASTECLRPQPWNKLEIPERLNGEGITIAIMAQLGGYLLFISDDGILLPAGYGMTLDDPTQPLPVMANQLQKALQPDAPDYVGKRIGKAKVFSSMARRAGVDNSAQILPIKLVIGDQESLIWFIGSVPHPDRAFAKRNPNPESKSKKSKLFSDEILANFTISSDILNPIPDSDQPTEETVELLDESCSEISNKTERHKADLGRLLALKSATVEENSDWQKTNLNEIIENQDEKNGEQDSQDPLSSDEIIPNSSSVDCLQNESIPETLASTVQSSLFTPSCPVDAENDVLIVKSDAIAEDIIPDVSDHEDGAYEESLTDNEESENAVAEDDITKPLENEVIDDIADEIESTIEGQEENVFENDVSEETPELTFEDNAKRYTVHPAHIDYPAAHCTPQHPALKMSVPLDAMISRRSCSVEEILSWKPGCVIEFDNIKPTIILESNGVILGRGKPIEQNLRIGIQLE